MSRLTPGLITLDKGLNLQTAKITAPEGSVLDTLNYEQVDFQGQKRIEGYSRYDGQLGSWLDDYVILGVPASEGNFSPGEAVFDVDGNLLALAVSPRSDGLQHFALINQNAELVDGMDLYDVAGDLRVTVESADYSREDTYTAEEDYDNILAINQLLRDAVTGLPGPIAALHWFRDRLYAVASLLTVEFADFAGIEVNSYVYTNDTSATVLHVEGNYVTLTSQDLSSWGQVGDSVYDINDNEIGTIVGIVPSATASFFESRTELQALEEDGNLDDLGWRFIHQGWLVPFAEGLSLYGSLPALNQNRTGLGVEGPTPVTGNSGRFLTLSQGKNINGEQVQVNGWKSSSTPNSYNLNPSDLWNVDTDNIYADAYISWDGSTGAVSAPGVTTAALIQQPANNTVEVQGV